MRQIFKGLLMTAACVSPQPLAEIQERRLTTFEIDLSELDSETKDDVRRAIYDEKNVRPVCRKCPFGYKSAEKTCGANTMIFAERYGKIS